MGHKEQGMASHQVRDGEESKWGLGLVSGKSSSP